VEGGVAWRGTGGYALGNYWGHKTKSAGEEGSNMRHSKAADWGETCRGGEMKRVDTTRSKDQSLILTDTQPEGSDGGGDILPRTSG